MFMFPTLVGLRPVLMYVVLSGLFTQPPGGLKQLKLFFAAFSFWLR
jgi:hypothetical protein